MPKSSSTSLTHRQIREALGFPRITIAARAGVAEPTVAKYEANEEAVTAPIRAKLDPVYRDLASQFLAGGPSIASSGGTR